MIIKQKIPYFIFRTYLKFKKIRMYNFFTHISSSKLDIRMIGKQQYFILLSFLHYYKNNSFYFIFLFDTLLIAFKQWRNILEISRNKK